MKDEYSKYKMNLQIGLGTNSLELVQVLLILLIFLKEKTLKAEFNVHCWDSMDTCFLGIYHYFFFFLQELFLCDHYIFFKHIFLHKHQAFICS